MRNKKITAVMAGLAALMIAGGSLFAYAADESSDYSYVTGQENGVQYADSEGADENDDKTNFSYVTGQENGSQYADSEGADENADKTNFSYVTGQENGSQYVDSNEQTDKSEYSYITGQENGVQYADSESEAETAENSTDSYISEQENISQSTTENIENAEDSASTETTETLDESAETEVQTDYSYNSGRQNALSRNNIYENLPEGGSKEDAEIFYEENDVGGGAWVDGAYDESAKSDYGYIAGQQRGASYAQENDGSETIDKSGYSYYTAQENYAEKYAGYSF